MADALAEMCRAFNTCPFDDVKVVILGQDPYHNVNQAVGTQPTQPWIVSKIACFQVIHAEVRQDSLQVSASQCLLVSLSPPA